MAKKTIRVADQSGDEAPSGTGVWAAADDQLRLTTALVIDSEQ